MKFWVGVTDDSWYNFLAERQPDEVNFWQPSGTPPFKKRLELFLFKLHSPLNYIAGGGYFVTYTSLPVSIAWETFGEKNGVKDYTQLKTIILKYRESRGRTNSIDPEIGCSVLAQPFFFRREDWIPIPEDWKSNIVRGKAYDTQTDIGKKLFDDVQLRLSSQNIKRGDISPRTGEPAPERYGSEYIARPRLGQGSFRALVTNAYSKRCAMTGERTLPVLEAAHIKSYAESGPHSIRNGLLLRADLHKLFDRQYITITPDLKIEVSKRIHEEYQNGKDYYKLHGKDLAARPDDPNELPAREYIEWHNQKFCG